MNRKIEKIEKVKLKIENLILINDEILISIFEIQKWIFYREGF